MRLGLGNPVRPTWCLLMMVPARVGTAVLGAGAGLVVGVVLGTATATLRHLPTMAMTMARQPRLGHGACGIFAVLCVTSCGHEHVNVCVQGMSFGGWGGGCEGLVGDVCVANPPPCIALPLPLPLPLPRFASGA